MYYGNNTASKFHSVYINSANLFTLALILCAQNSILFILIVYAAINLEELEGTQNSILFILIVETLGDDK